MKKLILLILCTLCTYITHGQIKLKPKWTSGVGYAGKEVSFNHDGTRMLTTSLNGMSLWSTITGEVIYTHSYKTVNFGGIAVNKDFSLVAYIESPNPGPGMIVKVCDIESGEIFSALNYSKSLYHRVDLAFNNSSDRLAMCTEEGNIVVWDLKEEKQMFSIKANDGSLGLKFIGKTNKLVSSDSYGGVKIINTENGLVTDSLQKSTFDAYTCISSDGTLAMVSYSHVSEGKPRNIIINTAEASIVNIPEELSQDWSTYTKLNHDGTKLALVQDSMDKLTRVKIWELTSGKLIYNVSSKCDISAGFYFHHRINAEFNETSDQFVLSGENGVTELHDLTTNSVMPFEGNHKQVHCAYFAGNSNKIVTTSDDGMIIEWSIETQKALQYSWGAPYQGVRPMYLTSDERYIITSAVNGPIALIDRKTGRLHKFLLSSQWASMSLGGTIIPCKDPSKIVMYNGFTSIQKLDILTGETVFDIVSDNKSDTIYKRQVYHHNHAFFNEDNNQIIIAFGAQTNVHDATTGKQLFAMKGHIGELFAGEYYGGYTDYVYSTNYNKIMTGGTDDKLRVWSATNGDLLKTFNASSFHRSLAFSKKQDIILINDLSKREIYKWDLSSMSLIQTFSPIKIEADRAFSCDLDINTDETLLAASTRDEFCILNFKNGHVLWRDTLSRWIRKVKFSNKSDLVAVGSFDGKIYIYNVNDGTLKFELIGHGEPVFFMQFCDNDSTLLTNANDGTIKLWYLRDEGVNALQSVTQNRVNLRLSNPVQNELSLFANYHLSDDAKYTIINSMGEKVFSGALNVGIESHVISINNLSPGMYIFTTEINGKRVQEKFVVMR